MPYEIAIKYDQLSDLAGHLERVRAYYAAEATALSRAAMNQSWNCKYQQYAQELISERMEQIHNAEELWRYLLNI